MKLLKNDLIFCYNAIDKIDDFGNDINSEFFILANAKSFFIVIFKVDWMEIEVVMNPNKSDVKYINEQLELYNRKQDPNLPDIADDLNFSLFIRNNKNVIVGGVNAIAFWNYLYIKTLWIEDAYRNKGIGKDLMEKAEFIALQNGFEYSRLETSSFQNKPFYEKIGYEVFGVINDSPEGHSIYFMKKHLKK